ncbi:DUF4435 domain-containing protein [Acinetobacter bereziniae]|uniref:DUF4435 domain-containing protein n=1 Tax=Acinetobacter bereziniae TaxID=106648 RepID=UPI0029545197|nr:DUF4435 domain-containing protein [Acinetobacter bereziniae]MDV8158144.1 DUF4435 domain-containing protein [Acinetobacter bereziniae]
MSNLEYSIDAYNVLDEFYEVDKILYVEGEDDQIFWSILFDKFYAGDIKIIEVDGLENLKPYISKVENNELTNAYVACDQDYNFFTNKVWHKNVICTYGHSIENSLISPNTILDVVRGLSKSNQKKRILYEYNQWIIKFCQEVEDLIFCDIHNEQNKLGFSILGDNCDRFFVSKKYTISQEKISSHLVNFFDYSEIMNIKRFIQKHDFLTINFIRGHFLFSAVMKFVTIFASELSEKKKNIAKDAFFSNIVISFEKNIITHEHKDYYESKILALS